MSHPIMPHLCVGALASKSLIFSSLNKAEFSVSIGRCGLAAVGYELIPGEKENITKKDQHSDLGKSGTAPIPEGIGSHKDRRRGGSQEDFVQPDQDEPKEKSD